MEKTKIVINFNNKTIDIPIPNQNIPLDHPIFLLDEYIEMYTRVHNVLIYLRAIFIALFEQTIFQKKNDSNTLNCNCLGCILLTTCVSGEVTVSENTPLDNF